MHEYPIYTIESAPENSRQALEFLKKNFGIVPNLAATMAESPTLLKGFVGAFGNFHGGSFSAAERQVLLLSNAIANRCAWAVAFHSTLALKEGVDPDDVRAVRERRPPEDTKLRALWTLTTALVEKRGHLDEADRKAFVHAGFGDDHVLEVVAGLAVSVMANYAGNITRPALEDAFKPQVWTG